MWFTTRESTFLGTTTRIAVSLSMVITTGIFGYIQLSNKLTSLTLDDKQAYPTFERIIPINKFNMVTVVQYLHGVLGVQHLAAIHMNDIYRKIICRGISKGRERFQWEFPSINFPYDVTEMNINWFMHMLKSSKYWFVYGILNINQVNSNRELVLIF